MRKLSFPENVRHRLGSRRNWRDAIVRRRESSTGENILFLTIGIVTGVATGMALAQRYGGVSGVMSRFRGAKWSDQDFRHFDGAHLEQDHEREELEEVFGDLSPLEQLEERVLEAYRNDPVLSERAVDIGAIDDGIIELTGWVHSALEAAHAVTLARGTPGVHTVVNHLAVRDAEQSSRSGPFADRAQGDGLSETRRSRKQRPSSDEPRAEQ